MHTAETEPTGAARLTSIETITAFVFAGRATFTLHNRETGNRFTFRVERAPDRDLNQLFFVAVLNGPDNQRDYAYLGTATARWGYRHGQKSKIAADAQSARTAGWLFRHLRFGAPLPPQVDFHHEGTCGRCGRPLTTPESVERGLGPVCAEMTP